MADQLPGPRRYCFDHGCFERATTRVEVLVGGLWSVRAACAVHAAPSRDVRPFTPPPVRAPAPPQAPPPEASPRATPPPPPRTPAPTQPVRGEEYRERLMAGIRQAQASGKHCGRPRKELDIDLAAVAAMRAEGYGIKRLSRVLGIPSPTLRRRLIEAGLWEA